MSEQLDAFRVARWKADLNGVSPPALPAAPRRSTLVFHLPAVKEAVFVLESDRYPKATRLVSVCGRTGPIRARATLSVQADAFEAFPSVEVAICPGCEVAWDKAESAGGVLEMFSNNGNRVWGSGGAVLHYKEPTHRPLRWKAKGQPSRRLLVVVRTETAPRIVERALPRVDVCADCHRHPCGCDL